MRKVRLLSEIALHNHCFPSSIYSTFPPSLVIRLVYEPCRRTEADEEFLMVRMQVFCLLIGALAFLSVRRQKAASANLFDQRKQGGKAGQPKRRTDTVDIELVSREEATPLADSMEVV
jgi:hypothetical protein